MSNHIRHWYVKNDDGSKSDEQILGADCNIYQDDKIVLNAFNVNSEGSIVGKDFSSLSTISSLSDNGLKTPKIEADYAEIDSLFNINSATIGGTTTSGDLTSGSLNLLNESELIYNESDDLSTHQVKCYLYQAQNTTGKPYYFEIAGINAGTTTGQSTTSSSVSIPSNAFVTIPNSLTSSNPKMHYLVDASIATAVASSEYFGMGGHRGKETGTDLIYFPSITLPNIVGAVLASKTEGTVTATFKSLEITDGQIEFGSSDLLTDCISTTGLPSVAVEPLILLTQSENYLNSYPFEASSYPRMSDYEEEFSNSDYKISVSSPVITFTCNRSPYTSWSELTSNQKYLVCIFMSKKKLTSSDNVTITLNAEVSYTLNDSEAKTVFLQIDITNKIFRIRDKDGHLTTVC